MRRLAISVEGPTEEEFVKKLLAPHLLQASHAVHAVPISLGRARSNSTGGGNVSIDRLAGDMANLIWNFDAVTSLVDFHGFRNKGDKTVDELTELVRGGVRKRTGLSDDRVLPYIQMHEFEGLLFSDVDAFRAVEGADSQTIDQLRRIRSSFRTPEEINDNWNTAPSRRISGVLRRFSKRFDGPPVAEKAGLKAIPSASPRFDDWVGKLEML